MTYEPSRGPKVFAVGCIAVAFGFLISVPIFIFLIARG
jgi:hypothetical protein